MKVFLPFVHGSATEGESSRCGMNVRAAKFAAAWMALLGDDADPMACDERLTWAAQRQAEWLAANDFDPTDPHLGADGSTANERARQAGYRLPGWWPGRGNQIESAIRSWSEPEIAARQLAEHSTHYDHMHRRSWYQAHVVWGVGAAEALIERGGMFYVVVTAPVEA